MSKLLDSILNKPVDLKGLIEQITFDPTALEDAAIEQPGLYLEASRYRTLKLRKRMGRELQRDMVKAELGLKLRKKKGQGEKLTEGAIKEAVQLVPEMVKAQKELNESEVEEEWAKGLVEVFRQRLKIMDTLREIRSAEVSSEVRKVRNEMAMGSMRRAAERARERFEEMDEGEER